MIKNLKRKIIVLALIAGLMVTFLSVPAWAVDSSEMFDMQLCVNEQNDVTVHLGDSFDVTLELKRTDDSGDYLMYAMTAIMRFDSDLFSLESYDAAENVDCNVSPCTGDQNGWTDVTLNYLAKQFAGDTWKNGTVVVTLHFKALKTGTSNFILRKSDISTFSGMDSFECTTNELAVTVTDEAIGVTGVELNTAEAELDTGKSLELKATVLPEDADNKKVTWSSSDPDVAVVDENGVVTAVTYSKTPVVITATTNDGNFSATCVVQTRFYDVTQALVEAKVITSGNFTRIYWAADNGIVQGTKDENGVVCFNTTGACTRQQMVIMLWRLEGRPEPESLDSALKFTDTKNLTTGAKKAVAWAVENGIISGYKDGTFKPDASISRASTVVMLWRMSERPEVNVTAEFTDTAGCSAGVMKAINWAASAGITKGTNNGDGTYSFAPEENCQRQHMVTFIYRFIKII